MHRMRLQGKCVLPYKPLVNKEMVVFRPIASLDKLMKERLRLPRSTRLMYVLSSSQISASFS